MLRCPACGCMLDFAPGEDTRIERYCDQTDPRDWSGGWMGLVSFASFVAFRLMPWIKRRNWCPRCQRTVGR